MKILVCVKQVPDTTQVKLNGDYTLERDFIAQVMNPADESALELALRLRDAAGGTVTALTMGPARAEGMLREILARGADEAALMTSPAFAGADTLVTAKALKAAQSLLGGFDLILCGKRAADGETGQVGPMLAALLGFPCGANCTAATLEGEELQATQLVEEGRRQWRMKLPAVLTLCEWSYRLRLSTFSGLRRAAGAEIRRITPEELSGGPWGLKASPTRVTGVTARPGGVRPCRKLPLPQVLAELEARGLGGFPFSATQPGREEVPPSAPLSSSPPAADSRASIAVVCEGDGSAAGEWVAQARRLTAGQVTALYEERAPLLPERLAVYGANQSIYLGRLADDCAQAQRIAQALAALKPDAALFPATVRGRFLSAWAAAKLDTGLTADCTRLTMSSEGILTQIRPAFGGNLTARIVCMERRPQMASVRPGVFPSPSFAPEKPVPPFVSMDFDALCPGAPPPGSFLRPEGFTPLGNGVSLQKADVVVTGGKGVGGKAGFAKLEELARLLGGVVGATRSAVDAGWADYARQIGQTGVTIRPRLYLAFGVSGMVQHAVGFAGADTVAAVNRDRNAPIFSCADYGIVADWEETADQWICYLKERKSNL